MNDYEKMSNEELAALLGRDALILPTFNVHGALVARVEEAANRLSAGWVSVTLHPWEMSSFGEQIVTPNDREVSLEPGVYEMQLRPLPEPPKQEGPK